MNEEKIKQLREAYLLSPENHFIHQMYITALLDGRSWTEAESELKLFIKRNGTLEAQLNLAKVLYELNKTSEGILLLESLIESNSIPVEGYVLLIKLYQKEENKNDSLKAYKALKAKFPNYQDEYLEEIFQTPDDINPNPDVDSDDRIKLSIESPANTPILPIEKPNMRFTDVGGMQSVKDDISMKIINPIKHADLFKQYGKKIGGGILLYGPPGCGKTYIAKATAGEIDATFISIGINDVLDMYLGQSEKQLHTIFEYARRNSPTVLFFDEVDALGASRNDMRNNAGRNVINQFLQELDGISSSNDGILVLGATNAPWYIDSAFKRPGRFDRIIFIPPPDEQARFEILTIQLKDKPNMEVDVKAIAKKTKDFTGADLKALVDIAIEEKLKGILTTGKVSPITTKDFANVIPSIRPSSREWFETARNYAIYSNQSGLYDDILKYLNIK